MKILGIDPGYGRCGFAILEKDKKKNLTLKTCGVITTKSQTDFAPRLLEIAEDFEQIFEKWSPDIVSIEDLFFVENVTTGMQVAQVRGVLLYLAHKFGAQIHEPKPVEIKQTMTGNGKATKTEMKKMVQIVFHLESSPRIDDAADAIAAAYHGAV